MAARKKRILFCGEFSLLTSGYARMAYQILSYLAKTGKYELAEMANYCFPMDVLAQRDQKTYQAVNQLDWKLYSVMPYEDEQNLYNSSPMNQFGEYRFNDVLLDFQPDLVISWLDVWMTLHLFRSPLRRFYKLVLMPAIDAVPQQPEWISTYKLADKLITYTDWAKDVLEDVGIKAETNPPGVDLSTYFPSNKTVNYLGKDDIIIIGTVMRNQKRKLYPDLIKAFEKFIKYCREQGNEKLANKTYLYLHTTYPDLGFELGRLVLDSEIGHKILFSYICRDCGTVFPSLWSDARTNCPNCKKFAAVFPSTQYGVPDSVLANIINSFTVYTQVSTNEGFGIPLIEAAACGVYTMATDYSAMEDVIRKIKGYPIKVANFLKEAETGRDFAIPDHSSIVEGLYKFLNLPESIRKKKGFDSRKAVEKHYGWVKSCKKWEEIIDSIDIDNGNKWNEPPQLINSNTNFLNDPSLGQCSTNQFLRKAIDNLTPNILDHDIFRLNQYLKQLNFGMSLQQAAGTNAFNDLSFLGIRQNLTEYNGKTLVNELTNIANNWNKWESIRCRLTQYNRPKFLDNIHKGKILS